MNILDLECTHQFWYVCMNSINMLCKYISYGLIDIWIKNHDISGLGKSNDLGTRFECEFLEYKKTNCLIIDATHVYWENWENIKKGK